VWRYLLANRHRQNQLPETSGLITEHRVNSGDHVSQQVIFNDTFIEGAYDLLAHVEQATFGLPHTPRCHSFRQTGE
jgi:hypothetical protein